MTESAVQQSGAWGLELTSGSIRLARVVTAPDGAQILNEQRFDAENLPGDVRFSPSVSAALAEIPANEPLAVCFPDRLMMCRGLSLPRSPADVTARLIDAQATAFFFDDNDRLKTASQSADHPFDPAMQWVLLCATQRKWLDEFSQALPPNVRLRRLSPRILTVACPAGESSQLLVEADDDAMTFALCADGQVLRAVVLDADESADAGEWKRSVRQSFYSLMEGFGRNHWPSAGIVRHADPQQAESMARDLAELLQLRLAVELSSSAAVAAAQKLLQIPAPAAAVNFAESVTTAAPAAAPLPRRRLIAALAACVIGLLLWYGITCFRDWSLTRKFTQLRAAEASAGGVERRLAVGHYLERNASPALLVFNVILTAAPPSLSMSSFGVNATGQCHLAAMVGSASELEDFMQKLQASPVLANVQLKSAHVEQQRWQIDMTADTKPMSGLMTALPAPPAKPPVDPRMAGVR